MTTIAQNTNTADRFSECLKFILCVEGGFCDHPADRGGATNQGITTGVYNDWRDSINRPTQSVKELDQFERDCIYATRYWFVAGCDDAPAPLDLVLFDGAVNHGPARSVMFLQSVLGVTPVRGYFGTVTIEAVKAITDVKQVCRDIISQRRNFYAAIIQADSTQEVFRKGWESRLQKLTKECGL